MPPSRIRTRATSAVVGDPARQRIVFGSCRYPPTGDAELEREYGVDALDAYAARLLARVRHAGSDAAAAAELPDALCLLGDQIYADETTPRTQEWIPGDAGVARAARASRSPTIPSTPTSTRRAGRTRSCAGCSRRCRRR